MGSSTSKMQDDVLLHCSPCGSYELKNPRKHKKRWVCSQCNGKQQIIEVEHVR